MEPLDYARPSRREARPIVGALAMLLAGVCFVLGTTSGFFSVLTLFKGSVLVLFFSVVYCLLFLIAGWFLMREGLQMIRGTSVTEENHSDRP